METNTPQSIYQLLPKVQKAIGSIAKDKKNNNQNYNFRGIDDVLNAIGPALANIGVVVSVEVLDHERTEVPHKQGFRATVVLRMRVTFTAPDGSSISNVTIGEAQDYNGDKATNKAMSVAFKYAAFMGLAIPLEPGVMDDSDHDDKPEGKTQPAESQKQSSPAGAKGSNSKTTSSSKKPSGSSKGNSLDTKLASTKQLEAIIRGISIVADAAEVDGEEIRAKIIDYINKRRKAEDESEISELQGMRYFDAERVIKYMAPKVRKAKEELLS